MKTYTENRLYLPAYCILELPIRECQDVCESAKIYFGELAVLNSKRRYLPYRDSQLAEMKCVDIRTIKRWHRELEANGFIIKRTKNVLINNENCEWQEAKKKKCNWKPERRIYINQHPKNSIELEDGEEPELPDEVEVVKDEERKKDYERDKNVPFHEGDKIVPFDEGDKNVPCLNKRRNKIKNNNRKKPAAAAAVFSSLNDKDIPQNDKEWISARFSKEDVSNAIKYCESPTVTIKTSLAQALKWACEVKPKIPKSKKPEVIKEDTRSDVNKLVGDLDGKVVRCHNGVPVTFSISRNCLELLCQGQAWKLFSFEKSECISEIIKCIKENFPSLQKRIPVQS